MTCLYEVFGPDACFDGSLPDPVLYGVLRVLGLDPTGWSRPWCLVAPVPAFDPAVVLPQVPAAPEDSGFPVLEGELGARVGAAVQAAEARDEPTLRRLASDPSLVVRREAMLGLARCGHPVRIAGWSEGDFLRRARAHPWGAALHEGRPLPALASLLALAVDEGIQPRVCFVLAGLEALHPTFEALAADVAGRVPLTVRRHAAAALHLGGGVPADPVLHRVLLREAPGDEPDLLVIAVQDPDPEVRCSALRGLQAAGALPHRALQRLARNDPDPDVRALLQVPVQEPLAGTLVPVPHEDRGAALAALAEVDATLALQLAEGLVQDADPELACVAARLVGAATPPHLLRARVERALPLLGYADWARRRIGVALLGSLPVQGDLRDELAESLAELAAHDPDPEVQREAAAALERWACED